MSSVNVVLKPTHITHEGGVAKRINYADQLRRTVMASMLWENSFYEDGISIADRIKELCTKVSEDEIFDMAVEARNQMKLRHVPLLLAREMTRNKSKRVKELLEIIIQRPDELTEFLAIYWKDGKTPISA